jgi:archaemetzincin
MELFSICIQKSKSVLILLLIILLGCNNEPQKKEQVANEKNTKKNNNPNQNSKTTDTYIDIQPYEGLDKELSTYVLKELNKVYPRVNMLPVIPLPKRAYYKPRNRYRADSLILIQKKVAKTNHVILGLTHKDISTDKNEIKDWGVMGLGYMPGNSCIVSTYRLKKSNLKEQFYKVVIHELGHTQGLNHCPDKTCLMTDAEGKNNTDNEKDFCKKCKSHLIQKGFNL